jgi:hypothetical protein
MKVGDPFIWADSKYRISFIGVVDRMEDDLITVLEPNTGEMRQFNKNKKWATRSEQILKGKGSRISESKREYMRQIWSR